MTPDKIIIRIPGPPVRTRTRPPAKSPARLRAVIAAYARLVALRERRMGVDNHGRAWQQTWIPGSLYRNDYAAARNHLHRVITLYGAKTLGRCKSFTDPNSIVFPKY